MKKGSRKSRQDQIDEHDMPTEPLSDVPPMFFPIPDGYNSMPGGRTVNAPFSPNSSPSSPPTAYPYAQKPSSAREGYPHHPFLPANPVGGNYGAWPTATAREPGSTRTRRTRKRRLLPALVGLFFFCVQMLLVVRFVVLLVGISRDITWIGIVTDVSEIFVFPFRMLWFQIPSVGTLLQANIELYTLIAVLIYGIISRLVVGILKLVLKSR